MIKPGLKNIFFLWITQKAVKTRNISLKKVDGLSKVESELSLSR